MKKRLMPGAACAIISGAAAEGFLNLCQSRSLMIRAAERIDELSIRIYLPAGELGRAAEAAAVAGCSFELLDAGRGRKTLRLFRRRSAAIIFALIFIALIFWSRFYIWEISVSGNESVSTGRIMAALSTCGVESGRFWPELSSEDIRSRVLVMLPELSWISVSMNGSRANVQVRERIMQPEMLQSGQAGDIVAAREGFIVSISATVGTAMVERGRAVEKGDVLISGSSGFEQGRMRRAQGTVMAQTFNSLSVVSPEKRQEKIYTRAWRSRYTLVIGNKRINFYSDSSISDAKCDTIISEWRACIKGLFSLPVSIIRQTDRFYETVQTGTDGNEILLLQEAILDGYMKKLEEKGQIIDSDRESAHAGGLIYRVMRARCIEDIGTPAPGQQE